VHGLDQEQASFALLGLVVAYNLGTLGSGPLDRRSGTRRRLVIAGATLAALCLAGSRSPRSRHFGWPGWCSTSPWRSCRSTSR
jgi:predicted MFS family arabinose efflux permease